MRGKRRTHRVMISLIGKPEGKKSLATMWHRWEDDIKVDHRETVVTHVNHHRLTFPLL
jgi:hypothetical protein